MNNNIREMNETLKCFAKSKLNATVYFLFKNADALSLVKADVVDELGEKIAGFYFKTLAEKFETVENIIDYSQADERRNVIYKFDLPEQPSEFKKILDASKDTMGDIPVYSFSDSDLHSLYGIIIVIDNGNSNLTLFKKHFPVNYLARERRLLILCSKTRISELTSEVLCLTGTSDLLLCGDLFYMIGLATLEKYLGLHHVIFSQAKICLARVEHLNLVEDISPLAEEAATNVAFAKKLIKAVPNSPVLKISPASVIEFSKNHPTLKDKLRYNAAGDKFQLKTKVSQKYFLKMLNDDYLISDLTHVQYEALAKDALSPSSS